MKTFAPLDYTVINDADGHFRINWRANCVLLIILVDREAMRLSGHKSASPMMSLIKEASGAELTGILTGNTNRYYFQNSSWMLRLLANRATDRVYCNALQLKRFFILFGEVVINFQSKSSAGVHSNDKCGLYSDPLRVIVCVTERLLPRVRCSSDAEVRRLDAIRLMQSYGVALLGVVYHQLFVQQHYHGNSAEQP